MILSDRHIKLAIEEGAIRIDPYDPDRLNPVSYDLTLGDRVTCYEFGLIHDVRQEPHRLTRATIGDSGFVVHPGRGYLMHTRERVWTDRFVPVLDGKSSVGRLFISVHQTAGFGDPGFDGQYTLEVTTLYSVRLYAGMRIAQMRFHQISAPPDKLYAGNYCGTLAEGPVPSRAHKQFEADAACRGQHAGCHQCDYIRDMG